MNRHFTLHTLRFTTLSAVGCWFFASSVFAADTAADYLLVEDLPFIKDTTNLASYLSGMFKLGIGIAVTLAVIMLVVNGIKYMLSDVPMIKGNAKKDIQEIIFGLILAFGSWAILYTINPNIVKFDLITSINKAVEEAGGNIADDKPEEQPKTCQGCVVVPKSLQRDTDCRGEECKLTPALISRLEGLNRSIKDSGAKWSITITEAWPPIYTHKDLCHSNGTCADVNFRGDYKPTDINLFMNLAFKADLSGFYEVKTKDQADALKTQGVTVPIYINAGASAPHFHIR